MAIETVFLISLFASIAFLLVALGIARWNWRTDIAPFNRSTNSIDILINPDRYMLPKLLPVVRILSVVGGTLLIGVLISLGIGLLQSLQ